MVADLITWVYVGLGCARTHLCVRAQRERNRWRRGAFEMHRDPVTDRATHVDRAVGAHVLALVFVAPGIGLPLCTAVVSAAWRAPQAHTRVTTAINDRPRTAPSYDAAMSDPTFDFARLETVSVDDPLRVLFSACLLGNKTGWDGQAYTEPLANRLSKLPCVRAVPFCPEDVSLGTPRPLTTLYDGHGRDVLAGRARVLETTMRDVTEALIEGARAMLQAAQRAGVEVAVMLDVSDSCGSHAIYIGHPDDRRYQQGPGVAAAMLMDAGVPIIAQRDDATLGRLVAALDPSYAPDPSAADFVDHPWYRDYFKDGPVGLKLEDYERRKNEG